MNRVVFIACFLLGGVGIGAGNVFWGPQAGAGLCALAMSAYLAWILKARAVGEQALDLADSFYYLGFLLTLLSLGLALMWYSGEGELSIGTVVFRFGVGLFSTMYGLAGRIVLVQFKSEEKVEPETLPTRI